MSSPELGDVRRIVVTDNGDGTFSWQYQREDGTVASQGSGTRTQTQATLDSAQADTFFAHGGMIILPDGF